MTTDPIPEPRGFSAWPGFSMPRAGTPAEQIALQDRAWTMLEPYATPSGMIRTRLSNAWLGEHGWRVQIVPHHLLTLEDGIVGDVAAAAQRWGHESLFGTVVEPGELRISAVWRVTADADQTSYFFGSHYISFHVLFPGDLGFAVHCNDGDYAVVAGPEAFVRAALPAEWLGASATAETREGVENEHGEGCIDGILEHYAPFMLD